MEQTDRCPFGKGWTEGHSPVGIFSNSSDFFQFLSWESRGCQPFLRWCAAVSLLPAALGSPTPVYTEMLAEPGLGESFSGCPFPALLAEPNPFPVAHHRWLIRIMERGNLLGGLLCWEWALCDADEIHLCVIQPECCSWGMAQHPSLWHSPALGDQESDFGHGWASREMGHAKGGSSVWEQKRWIFRSFSFPLTSSLNLPHIHLKNITCAI